MLPPKLVRGCFKVNNMKQVHFLFPTGSQDPAWCIITLALGSKNLGNMANDMKNLSTLTTSKNAI